MSGDTALFLYRCELCGGQRVVVMEALDFDASPFDHDALDRNLRTERELTCPNEPCPGKLHKVGPVQ